MLSHNVYFSLHDNSERAQEYLVAEIKRYLANHDGIVDFYVGRRQTAYQRVVNDLNFDVALNIVFADEAAHDAYQTAPLHNEFVERNQSTWKQVRVFDSSEAR